MRNFMVKTLSTFFYLGYLPLIPGTFASIVGIVLFYLVKESCFLQILLTLFLIILGFLISGRAEKVFAAKDSRFIVIDEVSGMLLSLLFIPYDIKLIAMAFILFRILDTFKPYPSDKLERLSGSVGIMSDAILAGFYTTFL